jgi:hypothetical protein
MLYCYTSSTFYTRNTTALRPFNERKVSLDLAKIHYKHYGSIINRALAYKAETQILTFNETIVCISLEFVKFLLTMGLPLLLSDKLPFTVT